MVMSTGDTTRGIQLALHLLNTRGLDEGVSTERLGAPADAVAWLAAHALGHDGLERLRTSPAEASILLQEMRRLRDATARAVEAFRAGLPLPADALYAIDRASSASRITRRLRETPEGVRLHDEREGGDPLAMLSPVAWGAAELVTTADPTRVRRCASARCDEWFVDTSKGGRRRWCSMERCGNRAKVAEHRRRTRERVGA